MTPRGTSPKLLLLALAALAALAFLLVGAERLAMRFYLKEGQSRAETALRLTVNVLDGHLRRYEALPELLADDDEIVQLVTEPSDLAHRAAMNLWLKETNGVLQSSDIYVMDLKGNTIAASNFDRTGQFHRPELFVSGPISSMLPRADKGQVLRARHDIRRAGLLLRGTDS